MNLADVQIFVRAARLGSFKAAADQLGVTRSAISKSISRLEDALGVVLVHRSPRSSSLTDAGRRFFAGVASIEDTLEAAVASVASDNQEVVGTLGVSLPTSLGAALSPALIQKFRLAWPRLRLSLQFDERYVDLIGSGLDVAIRIARRLEDSGLMSVKLGATPETLVASPGYLARHGTPQHPSDLKHHRCLDLGSPVRPQTLWRFRDRNDTIEVSIDCSLTTNTDLPLILAACLDDGILFTPKLLVAGELAQGRLVPILTEFIDPREWGIYAVYPSRNPPARVRKFIDFVRDEIPALEQVDRWAPFGQPADSGEQFAVS